MKAWPLPSNRSLSNETCALPTGKKWSFLPKDGRPRYLVCNSDEAEPGTFKDHMLLENAPFNLIEGLVLSAYAINAKQIFVYIRGEFLQGYRIFRKALAEARAAGFVGENILKSGYSAEIVAHRIGAGVHVQFPACRVVAARVEQRNAVQIVQQFGTERRTALAFGA